MQMRRSCVLHPAPLPRCPTSQFLAHIEEQFKRSRCFSYTSLFPHRMVQACHDLKLYSLPHSPISVVLERTIWLSWSSKDSLQASPVIGFDAYSTISEIAFLLFSYQPSSAVLHHHDDSVWPNHLRHGIATGVLGHGNKSD